MKTIIRCSIVIIFNVLCLNSYSQSIDRNIAVSAYLYNFARNVEWQNETAIREFHFLIVGKDEDLIREITKMSRTKTLRNKAIRVSVSTDQLDFTNVHLIFVTKEYQSQLVDIFDIIEGTNILLVSDSYTDKNIVMINFYDTEKGTLLFEINKANIINQHLTIMQDMILLGGTDIDVAELYREGQQSLIALHKNMEDLEANINTIEDKLVLLTDEIKVKTSESDHLRDSLNSQSKKISEQKSILDYQGELLLSREIELENQAAKIKERQDIFNMQSLDLLSQKEEYEKGIEVLNKQQDEILQQKSEISSQAVFLDDMGATIKRQRKLVIFFAVIVLVTILLGLTTYFEFRSNKKMNESLKAALLRAESADELKSAFLATMSHELRTPLNSIIGFTGMLIQELPGPLNDEQKKQLGMSLKSSRHLLSLINDILDLSKIEAGQLNLSSEKFNISEVIQNVAELSAPFAQSKKIELMKSVEPQLPELEGDKFRVQQVVINLVNNALKFTERGSVTIEALKKHEKIVVRVIDTGIGIEPDKIDSLFRPFIQIDSKITRKHEGTGLGLSICKKLMALMSGSIKVESQAGKGSVFTIELPFKKI